MLGKITESSKQLADPPDQSELRVIDLELGAKIINNTIDAAKQMIDELVEILPNDLKEIEIAFAKKNFVTLKNLAHYIIANSIINRYSIDNAQTILVNR